MERSTISIGVIIGSTRENRVGPQIARFVADIIRAGTSNELNIIDLKDWDLPFYNEPGIPSKIFDHDEYKYQHTRKWSVEIQRHDAFIFVTPQYNWGYPAVLKNAIDYLFNEWKGKPAMVVTYGGHGGSKCNAQLREVLQGIEMLVVKPVELTFPSREVLVKAATGQRLDLDGRSDSGTWSSEKMKITEAYGELLKVLEARS